MELTLPDFLPAVTPGLYIVATPIGNRGDITLRALSILSKADIICCEDTRTSLKLLQTFGIYKNLWPYHDYNGDQMRPKILRALEERKIIALISDAGMPLISDPGYKLVKACYEHHLPVTTAPGASSVLAGLVLSGMPSDRFMFCGFAKSKDMHQFKSLDVTLIFFEGPSRLLSCLTDMKEILPNRQVAVVREITKKFEQVIVGTYDEVIHHYTSAVIKGEIVIVLSPPSLEEVKEADIDTALLTLMRDHSLKEASQIVAQSFNLSRKTVYKRALAVKNEH